MSLARQSLSRRSPLLHRSPPEVSDWTCLFCQRARSTARFSTSARARQEQRQDRGFFGTRLQTALRNTKVKWKPIPVGLGISFLGAVQFYRVRQREKQQHQQEEEDLNAEEEHHNNGEKKGKPRKRERIRPSGPW